MDYKTKYILALERARKLYEQGTITESLNYVFPELAESEDERIRKEIITHCRNTRCVTEKGAEKIAKWIVWLEKQGEQNSVDKVEPKFHEGEWIISNNKKSTYQVIEVKRGIYVIRDNVDNHEYHIGIEECEKSGRLWTIKDARCGDVLAAHECYVMFREIDGLNIRCYCTYHYINNPSFHVDTLHNKDAFHPATKEQRDLLFQKIKEYGYEWDDEKKELKKTETKGGEE